MVSMKRFAFVRSKTTGNGREKEKGEGQQEGGERRKNRQNEEGSTDPGRGVYRKAARARTHPRACPMLSARNATWTAPRRRTARAGTRTATRCPGGAHTAAAAAPARALRSERAARARLPRQPAGVPCCAFGSWTRKVFLIECQRKP